MDGLVQDHPTYPLKVGANSVFSCLKSSREGLKDVFEVATKELEACQTREGKYCSSAFKAISYYRPTVVDTAGASTYTPKVCINYGGNDDDLIEV